MTPPAEHGTNAMSDLSFERDAFLELLTEALRAGPGSPAWHDAVLHLRDAGARADLPDYQLLLRAREHLESGKGWRSVRAGPQFTRDLLDALAREGDGASATCLTTWLSVFAALVIVVALAGLVVLLRGGDRSPSEAATPLATQLMARVLHETGFDAPPDAERWQTVGTLPLKFDRGLRPGGAGDNVVGGLVAADTLSASQVFAIDAVIRLRKPTDDIVPQLFVASSDGFIHASGTASLELALLLQGTNVKLALPSGELLSLLRLDASRPTELKLRLALDAQTVVVEVDDQRLWAGAHGLGDTAPRRVGVRFLQSKPAGESFSFQRFRVLVP